jgi:ribonuclease P protein component
MLAKRHRLTVAAFNQYFKTGRKYHGQYVTLVYSPAPTFHGAVVVGKKVYRRAVDRNRLRRQLYPVLRSDALAHGRTGVFQCLVKPTAAGASADMVRADLRALLARVAKAS